jgi:single-strand DNA-binding protein
MATNERFKDKAGEWQERAEWHTVVVWGKRAEGLAKLDLKGSKIYVDGRLQTRSWEDKEGNKRYSTEIVAQDVVLLGATRGAQERQPGDDDPGPTAPRHTSGPATVDPGWPDPTDDLPF